MSLESFFIFHLVVAGLTMFINVQTFVLDASIHTQAVHTLDAIEKGKSAGGSPKVDNQDAEAFSAEETPSAAVQHTVSGREQPCQQRAQDAADTMHRRGTHRVIDVQLMVDELDGKDQHRTADKIASLRHSVNSLHVLMFSVCVILNSSISFCF